MIAATATTNAAAAPTPQPYGTNDFGGFMDVLPPGTNGLVNGPDLAAFQATKNGPPHNDDQLGMYADILYGAPNLKAPDLQRFFKDSTFGVKPENVERTYSPRADVTIVRDKAHGIPHVYGETREGAEFGLGYATAEDRLFFIDVLRHVGRAQLSSFIGGAPANRLQDAQIWNVAPYTEADLQRQVDQTPPQYAEEAEGPQGRPQGLRPGRQRLHRRGPAQPAEDARRVRRDQPPAGPGELEGDRRRRDRRRDRRDLRRRRRQGAPVGADPPAGARPLRQQEGQARVERLPLGGGARGAHHRAGQQALHLRRTPKKPRNAAIPDKNSVTGLKNLDPSTTKQQARLTTPGANSNALLVSARESKSGRPLAVFGPQTAYFAPQILMEQEVHAPGLDAKGVAFPGTNLYVALGHGRDYSWSATSAGQDITDTWAVDLCEPYGEKPQTSSMHYMFRGACHPIEVLTRTNSWSPNLADQTPAGSETLRAERTKLGLVVARATIKGKPVAYVRLRSTYFHETDSALGISYFNNPDKVHDAKSFQRAAYLIGYTFNWFYIDDRDIAYFNAGFNPVRGKSVDPNFPARAGRSTEWKGWNPDTNLLTYTPARQRPQLINQRYVTSWNNKQAKGMRANDGQWAYGSTYRSKPLDDRIKRLIAGKRKTDIVALTNAMEDAATVDLRADAVLPWVLRAMGKPRDASIADAVRKLRAWQRSGSHRIDRNRDGTYEHTEAIRILDAWWPRLVQAQFMPSLGSPLFNGIKGINELDNHPNNHGQHLGSAWQKGWYGYVIKDLRTLLKKRVRGRYSRVYCGKGSLKRCRKALSGSLKSALRVDPKKLYEDSVCAANGMQSSQWCFDAILFRPLGAVTQPLIHFQNRPTYQQVVEVKGHRPR